MSGRHMGSKILVAAPLQMDSDDYAIQRGNEQKSNSALAGFLLPMCLLSFYFPNCMFSWTVFFLISLEQTQLILMGQSEETIGFVRGLAALGCPDDEP
jgi:hypothetical protein